MIRMIAALITLGTYSSTSFKSANSVLPIEFTVDIAVSFWSPCPCSQTHRGERGSYRVCSVSVSDLHYGKICAMLWTMAESVPCCGLWQNLCHAVGVVRVRATLWRNR